jgi:hypothetical protein
LKKLAYAIAMVLVIAVLGWFSLEIMRIVEPKDRKTQLSWSYMWEELRWKADDAYWNTSQRIKKEDVMGKLRNLNIIKDPSTNAQPR